MLAVLLLTTGAATAFDGNEPIKEPLAAENYPLPLPTAEEEARLRQQLEADMNGAGENELASLSPIDQLRQAVALLGLDPDDPVNLAAARVEFGLWTDATLGGEQSAIVDERYGQNGWSPDQFASTSEGSYRAKAAARLSNGDIVVVSRVKSAANQKTNLGIVRLNSRGQRQTWTNVNPNYGHYSNQYILYPNQSDHIASIYDVHDVEIHGNRIYVLVTDQFVNAGTTYFRPHLAVFNTDGSLLGWWAWCESCSSTTQDAVAMDIVGGLSPKLVILGRYSLNGSTGGFWTVRMPIESNGTPGTASFTAFPTFNGHNRFTPADIAFRGTSLLSSTSSYYVLTNRKFSASADSNDYDPCLLAINASNEVDTGFGTNGLLCRPFDRPGGDRRDIGIALKTEGTLVLPSTENLWVLVDVAQASRRGFGIFKMTDRATPQNPVFGNVGNGRSVYGGCNDSNDGEGCAAAGPIFTLPAKHHIPTGLHRVGGSLAISGYVDAGTATVVGGGIRPFFAQQNAGDGDLLVLGDHSSPHGTARFLNVSAYADNDFIALGWTRWPDTGSDAQTMVTARLQRNPDRIFYNGFLCKSGRPGC